jgi:hypothetical protein
MVIRMVLRVLLVGTVTACAQSPGRTTDGGGSTGSSTASCSLESLANCSCPSPPAGASGPGWCEVTPPQQDCQCSCPVFSLCAGWCVDGDRRAVSGLLRCPRRPEFSRDALQRRLRLVRQRLRGCCDRLLLGSELRANWRCGQRLLWSGRVPVLRGRCVLQRALQRLLLRALRGRWLPLSWLATYLWMRKQPPPRQSEVKP